MGEIAGIDGINKKQSSFAERLLLYSDCSYFFLIRKIHPNHGSDFFLRVHQLHFFDKIGGAGVFIYYK
jgi:hypothetical protein